MDVLKLRDTQDVQLPGTYSGTDEGGRVHICLCVSWARCAAREPWEDGSLADSTAQRVLAMYGAQQQFVLVAGDGCESAKLARRRASGRRWRDGAYCFSDCQAAHVPRSRQYSVRGADSGDAATPGEEVDSLPGIRRYADTTRRLRRWRPRGYGFGIVLVLLTFALRRRRGLRRRHVSMVDGLTWSRGTPQRTCAAELSISEHLRRCSMNCWSWRLQYPEGVAGSSRYTSQAPISSSECTGA